MDKKYNYYSIRLIGQPFIIRAESLDQVADFFNERLDDIVKYTKLVDNNKIMMVDIDLVSYKE